VKKLQLLLTLALGATIGQAAPVPLTSDDAKQVLAREQARTVALEHSDVAALERIMADDVTYINASGKVDTKNSYHRLSRSRSLGFPRLSKTLRSLLLCYPLVLSCAGGCDATWG
jgi:hypothetical protein